MTRVLGAAPLAAALLATAAHACEPALPGDGVQRTAGTDFVVAWRPLPAPLRTGAFFVLELAVCTGSGAAPAELRVDAVMPEHRHGMNYRPEVTALGAGRFRAEGLLLHMPGLWELRFDVRGAGKQEVVTERIVVK